MKYLFVILVCATYSCKKYYSCDCDFTDPLSGSSVSSTYQQGKLTKKDAEDACAMIQADLAEFSATCSISKE